MTIELILIIVFALIGLFIVISLIKTAVKYILVIGIIGIIIFSGIYLLMGEQAYNESVDVTIDTAKDIKDSRLVNDIGDTAKDQGKKAISHLWDWTKEKIDGEIS